MLLMLVSEGVVGGGGRSCMYWDLGSEYGEQILSSSIHVRISVGVVCAFFVRVPYINQSLLPLLPSPPSLPSSSLPPSLPLFLCVYILSCLAIYLTMVIGSSIM